MGATIYQKVYSDYKWLIGGGLQVTETHTEIN